MARVWTGGKGTLAIKEKAVAGPDEDTMTIALEATRKDFGPARQMLDSQSAAHLLLVILIAIGTMVGWMATTEKQAATRAKGKSLGKE